MPKGMTKIEALTERLGRYEGRIEHYEGRIEQFEESLYRLRRRVDAPCKALASVCRYAVRGALILGAGAAFATGVTIAIAVVGR